VASQGEVAGEVGKTVPVRVVARVRPLLPFETVQSTRSCVTVHGAQTLVMGKDRVFAFDAVFGPGAQQDSLYGEWVSPLVDGLFNGYNATVLAYGQTGTGKTFTMGSGDNAGKLPEELGVIPRVMQDIYHRLEDLTDLERTGGGGPSREVRVRVSYIEIYNEEIRDLLDPGTSKSLAIREKADGSIVVAGAKQVLASSLGEMQGMLDDVKKYDIAYWTRHVMDQFAGLTRISRTTSADAHKRAPDPDAAEQGEPQRLSGQT